MKLSRSLEKAPDDVRMKPNCRAHFLDQDSHLLGSASFRLYDPPHVNVVIIDGLLPHDFLADPCEDRTESVDVALVRPTDIALRETCRVRHWGKAVDEASALVNHAEIKSAPIGWLTKRQSIDAFIALSSFIKLFDCVYHRMVHQLASFSPLNAFVSAWRSCTVHIPPDLDPVNTASETHLPRSLSASVDRGR